MERLNDVYASKESKFLLGHFVRGGGERCWICFVDAFVYRSVAQHNFKSFCSVYSHMGFWHSSVYLTEGKL